MGNDHFFGRAAAREVTGQLITDPQRRERWFQLVHALQIASETKGGALEGWVFHGTDGIAAAGILEEGLLPSYALVQAKDGRWIESEGVHFGSANIAAFYAEDRIESLEDPDIDLVIFGIARDQLAQYGQLAVDGQTIDCPIDSRLRMGGKNLFELWEASNQDAEACMEIFETTLVLGQIPASSLCVFRSVSDVQKLTGQAHSPADKKHTRVKSNRPY